MSGVVQCQAGGQGKSNGGSSSTEDVPAGTELQLAVQEKVVRSNIVVDVVGGPRHEAKRNDCREDGVSTL